MSRDITSAMGTALSSQLCKPAIIVKLDFASGAVRVHSGVGNLTFAAETYTGLGLLGAIADIEETTDGSSNTCDLSLQADSSFIALALGEIGGARGRPGKVWFGLYDTTSGLLISDPVLRYSGVIDNVTSEENGQAGKLTVSLVDETGDQERARVRYYNEEDQKRIDPTDTSMRYVADLPNKPINWGNAKVYTAQPSTGGDNSDGGDQTSDRL